MPSPVTGPRRPRRFRLRRSSYPSTMYDGPRPGTPTYAAGGSSFTRRGLLGAFVLLVGGGAAELVHTLTGQPAAATEPRPVSHRLTQLLQGRSDLPQGTPQRPASPSATASATASTSASPSRHAHPSRHTAGHDHGHAHAHAHGSPHPRHSRAEGGRHDHDGQRRRHKEAEQHVTLPPPKLKVREHPAYQVDQLIPNPPKRALALTVDDGPDPDWTPKVLRLLDRYGMQASFCVVGVHAVAYPKLIRDIVRAGHIVVNHSYTHTQPFASLPQKRIVWEIRNTQRAIERAAHVTPQLFRSPGGDWSPFLFRALAAYGLEPLDWDVDPRDWALPGTKAITRRMLAAKPGEIVLCHDGGGNRSETVQALRKVLPAWKRRGYVTIPLDINPDYLMPGR